MSTTIPPYREPLRATVARNVLIAILVTVVFAATTSRLAHPMQWAIVFILALWPTFGGHWLELWFLNWLRPRLPASSIVLRVARIVVWFLGGCLLGLGMRITAIALEGLQRTRWPAWWVAGVAFIGIELIAHAGLQARGQPNFYNCRG